MRMRINAMFTFITFLSPWEGIVEIENRKMHIYKISLTYREAVIQ